MFGRPSRRERRAWLEVQDIFYDPEKDRFVEARASYHKGGGLPLLVLDFIDETRIGKDARNGTNKNISVIESESLVESFPTRDDEPTFRQRLIDIINKPYT